MWAGEPIVQWRYSSCNLYLNSYCHESWERPIQLCGPQRTVMWPQDHKEWHTATTSVFFYNHCYAQSRNFIKPSTGQGAAGSRHFVVQFILKQPGSLLLGAWVVKHRVRWAVEPGGGHRVRWAVEPGGGANTLSVLLVSFPDPQYTGRRVWVRD